MKGLTIYSSRLASVLVLCCGRFLGGSLQLAENCQFSRTLQNPSEGITRFRFAGFVGRTEQSILNLEFQIPMPH